MISAVLGGIAASPWGRTGRRYGALAIALLLFLLAFRRSGGRAGRLVERLETTENTNDVQRRMLRLAVLVIASGSLTACATAGSRASAGGACPPVLDYSREFRARAADELALLPQGSAVAEMLADYSVMRDQAQACNAAAR